MNSKIKHILNNYLNQDHRINSKLMLCLSIFSKQKQPLSYLQSILKKLTEPLKLFRLLILIHFLYLNNILPPIQTINYLTLVAASSKPNHKYRLDIIIHKDVINQYVLYLQKCFQLKSCTQFQQQFQIEPMNKLYRIINLLKIGVAFVDVLYVFGRYFQDKYQFIIDFNIIIADDFAGLYESKIKTILKNNKNLWNYQMKLQLQQLHQKMYVVYYNCYYYRYLKMIIPRFIDTQSSTHNDNKNRKTLFFTPNKQSKFNRSTISKGSLTKDTRYSNNDSNISLSNIYGKNNIGKIDKNNMSMAIFGKISKFGNQANINISESYISQFTCDMSDKKDQFVMDLVEENQSDDDQDYKVLASLQRVVAFLDKKPEELSN